MKLKIKKIPLFNAMIRSFRHISFPGSQKCWEEIYAAGGTSGEGSYGRLAEFKAEILNSFAKSNNINSVIEFGCGDGNQLSLFDFPNYVGLDVSKTAVKMCIERFKNDKTKSFFCYVPERFENNSAFKAELALSLDVIFHLIEEDIFKLYMKHLFSSSNKFVIIYSSNIDTKRTVCIKHRKFTKWVETNLSEWQLIQEINNKYPNKYISDEYHYKQPNTSNCNFFIYKKK